MQAEQTAKSEGKESSVIASIMQIIEPVFAIRNIFIGLDRDGTIVPYSDRPEDAVVDSALHNLLLALCNKSGVKVGIISARSIAQLRGDFDHKRLFLAGNYGMEISSPQNDVFIQPFALDAVPDLKTVRDSLACLNDAAIGVILEDHGYSLCLHWHLVAEKDLPEVDKAINELKLSYPRLMFSSLPTSYEVKPLTPWSKGEALNQIFKTYNHSLNDSLVLYAGDSPADEPAFAWTNRRGGISLKVGDGKFQTCSTFQMTDLKSIRILLQEIVALKR